MKAKLIRESISFERGKDPKAILGIGYEHQYHVKEILDALKELKNGYLSDFLPYKIEITQKDEEMFSAGMLGRGKNDFYGIQFSPEYGFEAWYENQRSPDSDSQECEDIEECIEVLDGWIEYAKEQRDY
jgi:hypothetical protein